MLWMPDNLLEDGSSIVASEEDVYFPAANILNLQACDVWRSLNSSASVTKTLTMTFSGGFLNNSSHPFAFILSGLSLPTCTALDLDLIGGSGHHHFTLPNTPLDPGIFEPLVTNDTITQAVLTITVSDPTQIQQVGKLFLGYFTETSPIGDPDYGGFRRQFAERVNRDYAVLGQKFAEPRAQYWACNLDIPMVGESVQAFQRSVLKKIGTFQPIWLVINNLDGYANGELGIPRYCTLSAVGEESLKDFGALGYMWGQTLALEQEL